jgi:hypothetical protein
MHGQLLISLLATLVTASPIALQGRADHAGHGGVEARQYKSVHFLPKDYKRAEEDAGLEARDYKTVHFLPKDYKRAEEVEARDYKTVTFLPKDYKRAEDASNNVE